jgi:hypothetical protein
MTRARTLQMATISEVRTNFGRYWRIDVSL